MDTNNSDGGNCFILDDSMQENIDETSQASNPSSSRANNDRNVLSSQGNDNHSGSSSQGNDNGQPTRTSSVNGRRQAAPREF